MKPIATDRPVAPATDPATTPLPTAEQIEDTARFLHSVGIIETPVHTVRLPVRIDEHTVRLVDLLLKDETRQVTGSYKVRGATAAVHHAVEHLGARRVVTASTGNFAAGVGWACQRVGVEGTALVPESALPAKVRRIEAAGLRVQVAGRTLDDAADAVARYAEQQDAVALHPFDHPATVAGQGSIAVELLRQAPPPDTLVVQLGGGGLFAGNALVQSARLPATRIVGVASGHAPAFFESVLARRLLRVPLRGESVCDGVAVAAPGRLGWRCLSMLADEVVRVTEAEVRAAMAWLQQSLFIPTEGAGAVGVAAVMAARVPGSRIAVILSGRQRTE